MSKFQHHSKFPKEKHAQGYLFATVSFVCRKSYKKPQSETRRLCPECRTPMDALSRKLSAPKSSDISQWDKVRFLVEHGFFFQPVYEHKEESNHCRVSYPRDLREAKLFVKKYQKQAVLNFEKINKNGCLSLTFSGSSRGYKCIQTYPCSSARG